MRRRPRWSLRSQILAVAALSLALAYVGSYYRLSRRGMREAKTKLGVGSFFYVSVPEKLAAHIDFSRHLRLAAF